MQRSGSQTALLVLSILNIIAAVLMLLGGLAIMLGGAFFGAVDSSEAAAALAGSGVTQGEAGALTALAGFIFVFAGIIELVLGILGVRAANDNQKIMLVWVLSIVQVALCAVSLITDVVDPLLKRKDKLRRRSVLRPPPRRLAFECPVVLLDEAMANYLLSVSRGARSPSTARARILSLRKWLP